MLQIKHIDNFRYIRYMCISNTSLWQYTIKPHLHCKVLRKTSFQQNLVWIVRVDVMPSIRDSSSIIYIPHLIVINFSVSSDDYSLLNASLWDPSFHRLQHRNDTNKNSSEKITCIASSILNKNWIQFDMKHRQHLSVSHHVRQIWWPPSWRMMKWNMSACITWIHRIGEAISNKPLDLQHVMLKCEIAPHIFCCIWLHLIPLVLTQWQ